MILLLDSNILVHYIRQNRVTILIEAQFQPFQSQNPPLTSVVCIGELQSLALQRNWGAQKSAALDSFLAQLLIADINTKRIINRYAEIDAYSQGKLLRKPLPMSARNMGKNDLWIAATASVLEATLLTTDDDFDHLAGVFLDVEKVLV